MEFEFTSPVRRIRCKPFSGSYPNDRPIGGHPVAEFRRAALGLPQREGRAKLGFGDQLIEGEAPSAMALQTVSSYLTQGNHRVHFRRAPRWKIAG
jgi:hypothetical protein